MAVRLDCVGILQLGDNGYFMPREMPKTLQSARDILKEFGLWMRFVDGNHDNFTWLAGLGAFAPDNGGAIIRDTEVALADNIWYLPRGYTWEWNGLRCMALGGAYSIDEDDRHSFWCHVDPRVIDNCELEFELDIDHRPYPVPGLTGHCARCGVAITRSPYWRPSWWPEELITEADVEAACARGQVDIMFTHDAPPTSGLDLAMERFRAWLLSTEGGDWLTPKMDEISQGNRQRLARVVDHVHPQMLFHGHYHDRYDAEYNGTRIVGLSRDKKGADSWTVLDTRHPEDWGITRRTSSSGA